MYNEDPQSGQLETDGLHAMDDYEPTDKVLRFVVEVREAVVKLTGGKATGVCSINAELFEDGGEAMSRALQVLLTAIWQFGTIPPNRKMGLVVSIWKGKGDRQGCSNYRSITLPRLQI